MNTPKINLGQSHLQDCFFVVGAQATAFRKLRQCELEIRSLEDAVHQHEITQRRNRLKLSKLKITSDEDLIDRDEIEWAQMRSQELLEDAKSRLEQFQLMKKQILESEPEEYWALGYEANEAVYWPIYFGKKMALEIAATGQPSMQTAEQIGLLPDDLKIKCLGVVGAELPKLVAPEQRAALIQALSLKD